MILLFKTGESRLNVSIQLDKDQASMGYGQRDRARRIPPSTDNAKLRIALFPAVSLGNEFETNPRCHVRLHNDLVCESIFLVRRASATQWHLKRRELRGWQPRGL